jgi:hypothetical protein
VLSAHIAVRGGELPTLFRLTEDWQVHESVTYFTLYSANFCCPVRTLRERDAKGKWRTRTPAMAAGLTDHVWSISE